MQAWFGVNNSVVPSSSDSTEDSTAQVEFETAVPCPVQEDGSLLEETSFGGRAANVTFQAEDSTQTADGVQEAEVQHEDVTEAIDRQKNELIRLVQARAEEMKKQLAQSYSKEPTTTPRLQMHYVDHDLSNMVGKLMGTISYNTQDLQKGESKDQLLEKLELLKTFSVKTPKDKRPCGITDMAVTSAGEILVTDKPNKAVKVFSSEGTFERFIGYKALKKPSRITVLPPHNDIVLCDSSKAGLTIFSLPGEMKCAFASHIQEPSAICVLRTDKQLFAVVDFATKSLHLFDYRDFIESKTQHPIEISAFSLNLDCPAYITSSLDGNLLVSDWYANCLKMFTLDGHLVWEINPNSKSEDSVRIPHAISCDKHHILAAEKEKHCLHVFDMSGKSDKRYHGADNSIGLVMGLHITGDTVLCAEYQGVIKCLKFQSASEYVQV